METDQAVQRSRLARAGISALNLIAPGLGVLRAGALPQAIVLMLAPMMLLGIVTVLFALLPTPSFGGFVVIIGLVFAAVAAIVISSVVISWRRSRSKHEPGSWWTRWYSLAPAAVAVSLAIGTATGLAHRYYKPFYMPAESMAPTLPEGDKLIADMRGGRRPRVGDIILFETRSGMYVKRVAALPGDRIRLVAGVPIVNGRAARQTDARRVMLEEAHGPQPARRLREHLPGEAGGHEILDLEDSPFDNFPEVTVPPGHIFVLGDNRDRSADSRVPKELWGVEMVPLTAIRGSALYIHWSSDRSRIGKRLF